MDFDYIMDLFVIFTDISKQDAEKFRSIISHSINYISSNLKSDISQLKPEDIENLSFACAAYAFYSFALIQTSNSPSSLKLSDVSLTLDKNQLLSVSSKVKNHFISACSSLLKDDNFYFGQVN